VADLDIADQAMAVVHQDVGHVTEPGFVAFGFFVQPRICIAATGVAVIAAALALEVDFRVAPRRQRAVLVFSLKALVRGPSLDEGAIDAEMLIAGESGPLGAELDALKEAARQPFVEEPLAVGAEGGVIPDFVFEVEADKPAVQQVVVDGFDQEPLGADGEQDLQQQGFEQHLGRHRGPAGLGVGRIELAAHAGQQGIDHSTQFAQRVLGRHPIFQTEVGKHRTLKALCASHRCSPHRCFDGDYFIRCEGGEEVFQRPAKINNKKLKNDTEFTSTDRSTTFNYSTIAPL